MTLFIGQPVTNTTAGLIGEHIACSAIIQRGWGAGLCQQDGFDIIAFQGRESYRVQVKACTLSNRRKSRAQTSTLQFITGIGLKKRMPNWSDFDILCLVSSETRACLFMPVTKINKAKITKSINLFTPENEAESWLNTIEVIRNDKSSKSPPMRNPRPRDGSSRNRKFSPNYW